MKKFHPLFCATGALAMALPAWGEDSKKEGSYSGHTEIHLGPITVGVSADVAKTEARKHPYLGVVLSTLSPQLGAQLSLPEGMGLEVDAVSKDSPADKAGIKQYDVLKKFNDQLLCTQEQLDVLVKAAGMGAKAALLVIRGGKEQNVEVAIGEHVDAEPGKTSFTINGVPGLSFDVKTLPKESGGIHEKLKDAQDRLKEIETHNADQQKQINEAIRKAQEAAHQLRALGGDGARMFSFYPDEHKSTTNHNSVVLTDADGTVEMSETNGHGDLKITDPSGAVVFSEPYTGRLILDSVPEKFRAQAKRADDRMRAAAEEAKKHEPLPHPEPKKFNPAKPPLIAPDAPKGKGDV